MARSLQRDPLVLQTKADGTVVTQADRAVEAFLTERILREHPDHAILTEETGAIGQGSAFLWVIDPIDGSRAYASRLPLWAISVGLLRKGEAYAGIVALPALGETYWADPSGRYCNGRRMASLLLRSLDDPLAFLAVPSNAHHLYDIAFPRIRSLGSTVVHLLYVAMGSAVGALTRQPRIWDLAGVLPLLQQGGVCLQYLSGTPLRITHLLRKEPAREPAIAAHASVIDQVRNRIRLREGKP